MTDSKTDSNVVKMEDGREVDFGKKTFLSNVSVQTDGSVKADVALVDGSLHTFVLPVWGEDKGLNDALSAYAAAGLRAALGKACADGKSATFKAACALMATGPDFRKPRGTKPPKLSPLQRALVELTGKTEADIVAWTGGKTLKERNALSKDPRVAAILARYAAEAAGEAKEDDEAPDLLAGLVE